MTKSVLLMMLSSGCTSFWWWFVIVGFPPIAIGAVFSSLAVIAVCAHESMNASIAMDANRRSKQ